MRLYWRTRKNGLDLVVENDDKDIFIVGGVRETKRGIEALAKTNAVSYTHLTLPTNREV